MRRSPARDQAPDPVSWFPLAELEALLAPDGLLTEAPPQVLEPDGAPAPSPEPTPAPAPVDPASWRTSSHPLQPCLNPTPRGLRRAGRRRARLAVVGAGLGVGLLFTKVAAPEGGPSVLPAEPFRAPADGSLEELGEVVAAPKPEPEAPADGVPADAAVTAAAPAPAPLPNETIWEAMAHCETGGNWTHPGPTWSGGLGIYQGTWQMFGGTEFASLPSHATREQQIIVAERIRARYGFSAWGCADAIGLG